MGKENFGLLREILGGIQWFRVLEGRGQASLSPSSRLVHPFKSKKWDRRPAWVSKKLQAKLRQKKYTECGKIDRPFGRNIGTLSEYAGM